MKFFSPCLLFLALICPALACPALAREADHICFHKVDADKDGLVTREEFAAVYGEDAMARFDEADTDSSGDLTHEEYHAMLGHGAG